jgi:Mn-dependent DtxR family transcriptional regulator
MPKPHLLQDVFNDDNSSGVALKNKALKKLIFNFLDQTESSSITELSKELNISVPKTTSLVNELIEEGLISDYGKLNQQGAAKPVCMVWLQMLVIF